MDRSNISFSWFYGWCYFCILLQLHKLQIRGKKLIHKMLGAFVLKAIVLHFSRTMKSFYFLSGGELGMLTFRALAVTGGVRTGEVGFEIGSNRFPPDEFSCWRCDDVAGRGCGGSVEVPGPGDSADRDC